MNRNRDGSFSTQSARKSILVQAAKQLKIGGFRNMNPESLKPKHIQYLVSSWQEQKLSPGTIKNRMAHLRWWAEKVGKPSMLPKSNTDERGPILLNIENRSYIPEENKAREIVSNKLDLITDKHVKLSLRMQREFGLRREEAIKFSPTFAVQGDELKLKASWTKGGRARTIPIRTESQKKLLSDIKMLVGGGALIPVNRNYIKQLNVYKSETQKAGMDFNHGLRHRYAQDRYLEIAGWRSPIDGGTPQKNLTQEQREVDRAARLIISSELGHERERITNSYLGT